MRPAAPVALLLACCAGCVRAPAPSDDSRAPAYRAPDAGCEAARAAARATLAAVRCEQDWDCVPYEQAWLGCDGWRDVRAPDPGVAAALLSACAGVPSRALECPGHAGACVEGRCAARPRPPTSCAEATAALAARAAASPGACETDAGCETWTAGASRWAVGAGFERAAAPELHRVRAACPEEPAWVVAGSGIELPALRRDGGRCVDGRCAPGTWPPAETGPRFRDPECLRGELARRLPPLKLNALGASSWTGTAGRAASSSAGRR